MRNFAGWLWLLSGLPVGVALIFLPPSARLACFAMFILVETAHTVSPIVLASTNSGFRKLMFAAPLKFFALPAAIFSLAVVAPFSAVVWVYWVWNIYHFGMQNFGVLSLWAGGLKYKWITIVACLAITTFGMIVPTHDQGIWFVLFGLTSVNHWVVDIGLSSWVSRHGWLFAGAILLVGSSGFLWLVPTPDMILTRAVTPVLAARAGLGFVHFLYSRWVWQLSNPQVRATIGGKLCPST